jgi:hypothetical protein
LWEKCRRLQRRGARAADLLRPAATM